MRIFAVSDLHIDYAVNARWVENLSQSDYQGDLLIVAGDISDILRSLDWCLRELTRRFRKVLFVPGNHDLWSIRDRGARSSLDKFHDVAAVVDSSGATMQPLHLPGISIYPLLGWYDYSFGEPSAELQSIWMDYRACRWPEGFDVASIADYFASFNDNYIAVQDGTVITFSHFLPRIDLLSPFAICGSRLNPVLGSTRLERQLRRLKSTIHVYGHSHINGERHIQGVNYVNNAFGYPNEQWMSSRGLRSIYER
jgi:Icc-related predicted phosphoesterase